ncbi:MAG: hypothetical protein ACKKL4_01475 [Patescibacteria group bacterium]
MIESRWMPKLKDVAERPYAYTSNAELVRNHHSQEVLHDAHKNLRQIFATFRKDKNFIDLSGNLKSIINTIEQECQSPLPIQSEPAFFDFQATLSELLTDHMHLLTKDEWIDIQEDARYLYEAIHTKPVVYDRTLIDGMDEDQLLLQRSIDNHHQLFASRMKMFVSQTETIIREFVAEYRDDPEQGLLEGLTKIMRNIREEWNKLPDENFQNILREMRDRCYSEMTETLAFIRNQIETLHQHAKISPQSYQLLRDSFESIYQSPKQLPHQE